MDFTYIYKRFDDFKDKQISGRYLDLNLLYQKINQLPIDFDVKQIGVSVNHLPIYVAFWGKGTKKILAWSQMHGNETTTTKALFDLVSYLTSQQNTDWCAKLKENCSLAIVFVLNPDGAKMYTRVNANNVDLNRDALKATQPEMKALHQLYHDFKPDLCLNLHGQRTIFSAGMQAKPATVSFLSPSVNETRSLTSARMTSMRLISEMNSVLQKFIPQQVGRYDDGYNPNCTGDHFQSLGTPTILFEAGHFPNDYAREETRKLILLSYLKVLDSFVFEDINNIDYSSYLSIPQNQKLFYDIIFRNIQLDKQTFDMALQYEEVAQNKKLNFIAKVSQVNQLENFYAHKEVDINHKKIRINGLEIQKTPSINAIIQDICTDNDVFDLKNIKI